MAKTRPLKITYHNNGSLKRQPKSSFVDRARSSFLLSLFVLLSWVVVLSIFSIKRHNHVRFLGYQIDQELKQKAELEEQNKALRLEIARLKSPLRLENEAKTKLKLQTPKEGQLVYFSRLHESEFYQLASIRKLEPSPPALEAKEPVKKIEQKKVAKKKSQKSQLKRKKNSKKTARKSQKKSSRRTRKVAKKSKDKMILATIVKKASDSKSEKSSKNSKKNSVPAVIDGLP